MSRLMSLEEIGDALWRNPLVYARVAAHKLFVMTGEWEQVTEANNWILPPELEGTLPISPSGFTFTDDRFGDVIIFPNTAGILFFNTDVTAAQAAAVSLPPYTSPDGNTAAQIMADIKRIVATATNLAVAVAVALGLLILYKEIR